MIRLYEVAAREKEVATRVQTQLLKKIGTRRKLQFFPTVEGNAQTPLSPPNTWESAHSTESSRRNRSETYEDDKDLENSKRSRIRKFLRIEDIADLVQKWINQVGQ